MAVRSVLSVTQMSRSMTRTFCSNIQALSEEKYVAVKQKQGVRTIKLNSAATHNSMSLGMLNALIRNIRKDQNNNELRSIVITSVPGKVFSAGHNLNELQADNEKKHKEIFDRCSELMLLINQCPVPVIAAVDGLAAAAGCQLVASCDIAICTERSTFSTPGANVGIFCSTPGIPLIRNVSQKMAMRMLFTGLPISADEAYKAGLVSKVVPNDMLVAETELITSAINIKSRSVMHIGKEFLYKQMGLDIASAYSLGSQKMVENLQMYDAQEGIKSFLEKRKPEWKHDYPPTKKDSNK